MNERADLDPQSAGDFGAWLLASRKAVAHGDDVDVPCGSCTACCRSSFFVHIEPDEADTLAHVPAELLFPAPGAPTGHVLLGYDERGHCPMLGDAGCTIYEHRPRTCRTFDCRVFAAAGLDPADDGKTDIAVQVRRWRFSFDEPDAAVAQRAVEAAAAFLRAHPSACPNGRAPSSLGDLASMAVQVHERFLTEDRRELRTPSVDEVAGAFRRRST